MIVWLPQIVYLNVRFGTWEKPKYFYFIYLHYLDYYGDDDMCSVVLYSFVRS